MPSTATSAAAVNVIRTVCARRRRRSARSSVNTQYEPSAGRQTECRLRGDRQARRQRRRRQPAWISRGVPSAQVQRQQQPEARSGCRSSTLKRGAGTLASSRAATPPPGVDAGLPRLRLNAKMPSDAATALQERHRDHERVRSEEQQLDGDQRLVKSWHEIVVGVVDRERAVLEIAHRAREVRCQAVPDVDGGKPGQEEDGAKVGPITSRISRPTGGR